MTSNISFKLASVLFVLLLFYIFLSGIGSYGLLAKDEPRYMHCAIEMIQNNNFIVPQFNYEDRFDKPPFFYWMIAASYKLFGINHFLGRLPSALSAILLVLFTWYTGTKILGKTAGFLSAIILSSSVEYIMLGRRGATDIALCLFFSGALYSMYLGYFVKDWKIKIFWTILSGFFAGLALLTKGPVAILFQFGILTIFLIFRRQFDIRHLKVYFIILFFALLVSLPWYIAVHHATGGAFTKTFFFTHNFERFTSVVGEHPGPIWFYFPVVFLGFMPWTLFFLSAVYPVTKHIYKKNFNKFILFCLIWFSLVFLFFTFCKTKMLTYILLLYPAISLITGWWLNIALRKSPKTIRNILLIFLFILAAGSLAAYFFISKSNLELTDKAILMPKLLIAFALLLIGLFGIIIFIKKRLSVIFSFVLVLTVPGIMVLNSALNVYHKITFGDLCNFAREARELGAKEIISFGGYKPILVYYGGIPVDFNDKGKQIKKIKELLASSKDAYIIGYLSDLKGDKPIVRNNTGVFKQLKIIHSGKRYFLGRFS